MKTREDLERRIRDPEAVDHFARYGLEPICAGGHRGARR